MKGIYGFEDYIFKEFSEISHSGPNEYWTQ